MEGQHAPGQPLPLWVVGRLGELPNDVHGEEEFKDGGEVDGPRWDGESVGWFGVHDCRKITDMIVMSFQSGP